MGKRVTKKTNECASFDVLNARGQAEWAESCARPSASAPDLKPVMSLASDNWISGPGMVMFLASDWVFGPDMAKRAQDVMSRRRSIQQAVRSHSVSTDCLDGTQSEAESPPRDQEIDRFLDQDSESESSYCSESLAQELRGPRSIESILGLDAHDIMRFPSVPLDHLVKVMGEVDRGFERCWMMEDACWRTDLSVMDVIEAAWM